MPLCCVAKSGLIGEPWVCQWVGAQRGPQVWLCDDTVAGVLPAPGCRPAGWVEGGETWLEPSLEP